MNQQEATGWSLVALTRALHDVPEVAKQLGEANTQFQAVFTSQPRQSGSASSACAVVYLLISETQPWADAVAEALNLDEFLELVRRHEKP